MGLSEFDEMPKNGAIRRTAPLAPQAPSRLTGYEARGGFRWTFLLKVTKSVVLRMWRDALKRAAKIASMGGDKTMMV